MIYIYNDENKQFYPHTTFQPTGIVAGDPVLLVVGVDLDAAFIGAKRRTAIRGRFAKDQEGKSKLREIELTDDEREWFDDIMDSCASEVLKKMSAWTKNVPDAMRYNVKSGEPLFTSSIALVDDAVLTDAFRTYTANELTGKYLVITSPGSGSHSYRAIVSNTADTIALQSAFDVDVTGKNFLITSEVKNFAVYHLNLDMSWDMNLIEGVGVSCEEAFVLFALKEWYRINRYADDYRAEEEAFQEELRKIRSGLILYKAPARRTVDTFGSPLNPPKQTTTVLNITVNVGEDPIDNDQPIDA